MNVPNQSLLEFQLDGQITVGKVAFSSVLTTINVADFAKQALDYVHDHPGLNLLLNFEKVDFLSSAVLTELLRIKKAVEDRGGRLRLCGVVESIQEVFQITNLDQVFTTVTDPAEVEVKRFERSVEIAAREAAWENPSNT